jgi:hypothetical protein
MLFFWKMKSVIYRQRLFFEENLVVAMVKVDLCLFLKGEKCYIYTETMF